MAGKYANSYYKITTFCVDEDGLRETGFFTRSKFVPLNTVIAEARREMRRPGTKEVRLFEVYDDGRCYSPREIKC
jgi:hypothetical protein